MTPRTDSARGKQRMAHIVLGDLLDRDLPPLLDWSIKNGKLNGWVNDSFDPGGAETVAVLTAWSRALWTPIQTVTYQAGMKYALWYVEAQVDGVKVDVTARLSPEYAKENQPPPLEPEVPARADMYVRRSNGQLTEAVK